MATPSPIRDILEAIGRAIAREMVRLLNANGRYPLRKNSALARQLLSDEAVQVTQGRTAGGQFAGYTADSQLTILAQDYIQWVDTGRKPGGKKVPISAILEFIKNRNLRLRDRETGRFARKTVTLKARAGGQPITVNQLAFLIQSAIYKNGIRGRHFISPAWDYGQELTDIYLNNQLLDSLTVELERTLKFF